MRVVGMIALLEEAFDEKLHILLDTMELLYIVYERRGVSSSLAQYTTSIPLINMDSINK